MNIIKTDVYMHKYDGYIAYLHQFEDGTLMLEYVLEFENTEIKPCTVSHRVVGKKLDRAYKFICSLEDYDQETKGPKKTKSVSKGIRSTDDI